MRFFACVFLGGCGGAAFSPAVEVADADPPVEAAEAGTPEATAPEASVETGAPEAAIEAETAAPCVTDLSGVGAGDFSIAFTVTVSNLPTQGYVALVNQRQACTVPYWDVIIDSSGGIVASTSTHTVEAGNSVNDGQPHRLVVQRKTRMLSFWSDGVLRSGMVEDSDVLGTLPPMIVGSESCQDIQPMTGHATLSDLCVTF